MKVPQLQLTHIVTVSLLVLYQNLTPFAAVDKKSLWDGMNMKEIGKF